MRRLLSGGIALGVATAGFLVLAGPGAAQETEMYTMSAKPDSLVPGEAVEVTSVTPCVPDQDADFTVVDVAVHFGKDEVVSDTIVAYAPDHEIQNGEWSWTWQTAADDPEGEYTISAACVLLDREAPSEDPLRTHIADYYSVSVDLKDDRIGPTVPPPAIDSTTPTTDRLEPIGAGFAPPPAPPATPVAGQPTFPG